MTKEYDMGADFLPWQNSLAAGLDSISQRLGFPVFFKRPLHPIALRRDPWSNIPYQKYFMWKKF
ncbi:hypothetical protein [Faecalibaculum rodentium]|uniref:hypothetical protein n=1 Tax=Faecalibaculum rodentium TaxID=1702221 RepID=UPI003F663CB4